MKTNPDKTRLKKILYGMKQRCYNPNAKAFVYYGAKGITICEEWLQSFDAFYDWAMANGYSSDLTIDRKNVRGNYEPSNCRWANSKQQADNTTRTIYITYQGETKTLLQWCIRLGFKYTLARGRYYNGWPIEMLFRPELQNPHKRVNKKVSPEDIRSIRQMVQAGQKRKDVAAAFKISRKYVNDLLVGRNTNV